MKNFLGYAVIILFMVNSAQAVRKANYKDGPIITQLDLSSGVSQANTSENYSSSTPSVWPRYIDIGANPLFFLNLPVSLCIGYDGFVMQQCLMESVDTLRANTAFNMAGNGFYIRLNRQVSRFFDLHAGYYQGKAVLKTAFPGQDIESKSKAYGYFGMGLDFNFGRLFDPYDPNLIIFNHIKLGFQIRKTTLDFSPVEGGIDPANNIDRLNFNTPVLAANLSVFFKRRVKPSAPAAKPATAEPERLKSVEGKPSPAPASPQPGRDFTKIFLDYYSTHPSKKSNQKVLEMLDIRLPDSLKRYTKPKILELGEINSEMIITSLKNNVSASVIVASDSLASELVNTILGAYKKKRKKSTNYVIPKKSIKILKEEEAIYVDIQIEEFEQKWKEFVKSPGFQNPELVDRLLLYLGPDFFSDSFLDMFQEYRNPILARLEQLTKGTPNQASARKYLIFNNEYKEWRVKTDSATTFIRNKAWMQASRLLSDLEKDYCDYGIYYFLAGKLAYHKNDLV
jgi:hypothetical protein